VGSNYNNTDKAGVFNTNINNAPTDTNVNISFRAAFNTCFSWVRKQVHLFNSWSTAPNTKKMR
jgi:hypothetical protein